MGLRGRVAVLLDDEIREVYECRKCGTNLSSREAQCPYCGQTDVVHLELPE